MSDDPWDTIEDRFPAGKAVTGEVTKTKKYGAFLQIADGVEGLLHISELSWDHVERTEDVLKVGEVVEVMVLSADKVRRRISLSLRQLHGGGPAEGGEDGSAYEPPAYQIPDDEDEDDDIDVVDEAPEAAQVADAEVPAAGAADEDEDLVGAATEDVSGTEDDVPATAPIAAEKEPSDDVARDAVVAAEHAER
jgi:transcriptional accessory protein Tex/SPT6